MKGENRITKQEADTLKGLLEKAGMPDMHEEWSSFFNLTMLTHKNFLECQPLAVEALTQALGQTVSAHKRNAIENFIGSLADINSLVLEIRLIERELEAVSDILKWVHEAVDDAEK